MTRASRKERSARRTAAPANVEQTETITGIDGQLLASASVLIMIGVVMSYSTTAPLALSQRIPPHFLQHLTALSAGVFAAIVAGLMPLPFWHRVALPLWGIAVSLLALTAIFGIEVNGAQRWLEIPGIGFRFQPVEPTKFATLLAVAAVIAPRDGHRELSRGQAAAALALALPPICLLLFQPDLGNSVLLAMLVASLLIVAGIPLRTLIVPGVVAVIGLVAYIQTNAYAMRRITSFLDPESDPLGAGFQLLQSKLAFSHGGLWGVGLGNGRQKLLYLPEAHTDFILALVAEELGLVGVLFVLGAFAALLLAGTRIARHATSRFGLLLAMGGTGLLAVPAAMNAGVVMGLLPTKGLTLPFLSYGGTSLVISCAMVGVLAGIARSGRSERSTIVSARGSSTWH